MSWSRVTDYENRFHSNSGAFRVGIIEDSVIHREWLKTELLSSNYKIEIVSADRLGRNGIESVKKHKTDIVVLDFQLEDMTGIEVSRRIKSHNPETKVFVLTAHNEASIIERIIDDKNIDAIAIKGSYYFESYFLMAIMYVLNGGTYLDPSLLKNLRESKNYKGLNKLTKREFEVFIQSNTGKSDYKIAADLCVELSHVKNLKSRITKKIRDENIDSIISKLVKNIQPD